MYCFVANNLTGFPAVKEV